MTPPALVFAALVVLSALVDVARGAPADVFGAPGVWLAGLALAIVASRVVRARPRVATMLVRLMIAGATAVAIPSLVEVGRIAWAADGGALAGLARALLTTRLAPQFADLNAAGSCFALFGVTAWWLARESGAGRGWMAPALVILLAMWLTGSRSALVGTGVAAFAVWCAAERPSRLRLVVTAASMAALLLIYLYALPARVRQGPAAYAMSVRFDMFAIALRLTAAHPVLGVGLGHFQTASIPLVSSELIAYFPPAAAGENAHNNFLQVLAELGVPGLLAFLWLLGAPLVSAWRALRAGRARPETTALTAGIIAFLISCLSGHPLLHHAITISFLVSLGVLSGLSDLDPGASPPDPQHAHSRGPL